MVEYTAISGYTVDSLSVDDLELLQEALGKFEVTRLRLTSGSQLGVEGLPQEQTETFRRFIAPLLTPLPQNGITSILTCSDCSRRGSGSDQKQQLISALSSLELPRPMPGKIKVAVAGCPRCCTMPRIRDIGLIPGSVHLNRWHISFGGNGGRKPRIGDLIGTNLSTSESIELIRRALVVYQQGAGPKMRTADYLRTTTAAIFLKKIQNVQSIDSGQRK